MTKHKELTNEILLYLHKTYPKQLRAWEIDTGSAYAKYSVKEALKEISLTNATKKLRTIFYGKKGHPDITGVCNGHWFGIEVKIMPDKQNPEQVKFQEAIEKVGGLYILYKDTLPMEEQLLCLRRLII